MAEDGNEPKIEPDAKKSKTGAKRNGKEAAGEVPVLSEDPSPPDQKTSPSGKSARAAPGMWMGLEPGVRRRV